VEFRRGEVVSVASSGRRIAVVAAHADDEVWHIILADGETSRGGYGNAETIARREAAAQSAATVLGVQHLVMQRLPDNRLDAMPLLDIVRVVEQHVREIVPDAIYTHHVGDLNVDHRRVHEAVLTACRPQPGCSVTRLLFFETASSTEWQTPASAVPFLPNWFVDISDTIDAKISALKAYESEMRAWPHPRSPEAIQHLARWRGAMAGCTAAEAFILGREIRR
jgi:LmbE family N-acetylglucosaminyl deacetylase